MVRAFIIILTGKSLTLIECLRQSQKLQPKASIARTVNGTVHPNTCGYTGHLCRLQSLSTFYIERGTIGKISVSCPCFSCAYSGAVAQHAAGATNSDDFEMLPEDAHMVEGAVKNRLSEQYFPAHKRCIHKFCRRAGPYQKRSLGPVQAELQISAQNSMALEHPRRFSCHAELRISCPS